MLKIRIPFLLFIASSLFMGCEREVILDLEDQEQNIVIFSLFSPNDVFSNNHNFNVEVSSTQSILDESDFDFLEDAEVTITAEEFEERNNTFSEQLAFTKLPGSDRIIYRTDNTLPETGFEYELQVKHEDFPTINAKSFVPALPKVAELELSEFKKSNNNLLPGQIRYVSRASINIENDLSNLNHYHLMVWLWNGSAWNPINIEEDVLKEQLGADATIVNVASSLEFFGAHFNDLDFAGTNQELNFDISFVLGENDNPSQIKVELRSVSKDYHNFFVDGYRLSQAGSNSFFVNSDNISNNINNGYGVFAGYSTYAKDFPFRK